MASDRQAHLTDIALQAEQDEIFGRREAPAPRSVSFVVPGQWCSERKRTTGAGRYTRQYDLPDRANFKAKVTLLCSQAMRSTSPMAGPLAMNITFIKPRPPSWPKRPTKGNPWPNLPWKKPDLTNLVKIAEDAMTGTVWYDDAQIVSRHETKLWGDNWQVQVTVSEVRALE